MPQIRILIGTMTGNAELCADEMAAVCEGQGFAVDSRLMDGLTAGIFQQEPADLWIICCSTYGQGDVPDNAQAFFDSLQQERPELSGLRYGVFALGDTTYLQTFCHGGLAFDRVLTELGAERVGEVYRHNASAGTLAEDDAAAWATDWIATGPAIARAA